VRSDRAGCSMSYLQKYQAASRDSPWLPTPPFLVADHRLFKCYPADISSVTLGRRYQTLQTWAFYACVVLVVAAVTFVLSRPIWVTLRSFGRSATIGVTGLAIVASCWGLHDGRIHLPAAVLTTSLFGISLGMASRWYHSRNTVVSLHHTGRTPACSRDSATRANG